MGTQDKIANKAQDVKGHVKETAGRLTGNERLEAEGQADQVESAVKGAGEKVKDAASKVKDAFTD